MKILHITAVRELGIGQRQQLTYEYQASKKLKNVQWDILAYHSDFPISSFEKKTPKIFDLLILRNLYFWVQVLKYSKKYDLILLRYMPFDLFGVIFSPFIKNRISIHHSKEIQELPLIRYGWKGKLAAWIEQYVGKVIIKNSKAIMSVTQEIALYENGRIDSNKPTYVYPNGIDFNQQPLLDDNRILNENHIFFICSYFSEWHGLDILLDSLENTNINTTFYIHLIGHLNPEQIISINKNKYNNNIIIHGELNKKEYIRIAEKCDIGIASLALFRKNLEEASTLKVREMLAMGLPVFSGHKDVAFDESFSFYTYKKEFNFEEMIEFSQLHKSTSRQDVRNMSRRKLEKLSIMNDLLQKIGC